MSPLDVWSAVGTTTWDFGDGTTATGTSATHQYAAAGARLVTITSTDALNNATTDSSTITVTPAAAPTTATDPTPLPETPTGTPSAPTARKTCASRRVITLHFKLPAGQRARTITLAVTDRAAKRLDRAARQVTVDLHGVTIPTVTVTI